LRDVRRRDDRCGRRVGRALRRALDRLEDERDDRRDERRDDRREPPRVERAKDVPWSDFSGPCLAHWLSVEISRDRLAAAQLDAYVGATGAACSNPDALAQPSRYPNGQLASTGTTWYFPNGQIAVSDQTFYYPSGQLAKTGDGSWYYPNGQLAYAAASGWYYPNGSLAGTWEALVGWARGRAKGPTRATFEHAILSDVDPWRAYATVRLAYQVR
jgi:hypothetical protein